MKFIITGTSAYGPQTENSDLDIVVLIEDAKLILNFLTEHGIKTYRTPAQIQYDDSGYYFNLVGIKINIITAATEDVFRSWKERTQRMKQIAPIPDREDRVAVFNTIVSIDELIKRSRTTRGKTPSELEQHWKETGLL